MCQRWQEQQIGRKSLLCNTIRNAPIESAAKATLGQNAPAWKIAPWQSGGEIKTKENSEEAANAILSLEIFSQSLPVALFFAIFSVFGGAALLQFAIQIQSQDS